jgi:hypothetical protein
MFRCVFPSSFPRSGRKSGAGDRGIRPRAARNRARPEIESLEGRFCLSEMSYTYDMPFRAANGSNEIGGWGMNVGQKVHFDVTVDNVPGVEKSRGWIVRSWIYKRVDGDFQRVGEGLDQVCPAGEATSFDYVEKNSGDDTVGEHFEALPDPADTGYVGDARATVTTAESFSAGSPIGRPNVPLHDVWHTDGVHVDAWNEMDPRGGFVDPAGDATISVRLDPAHCPKGATLSGATTQTMSGGVAVFSDLRVNLPGDYTFIWSSSDGLSQWDTGTISAPPVERLAFDGQPASGTVNTPLNTVALWVKDKDGRIDTSFKGEVGLSLGANPGHASLTPKGGTLMVHVVNGRAVFKNLIINKPGQGYTLLATCTNGETAVSNPFNISGKQLVKVDEVKESDYAGGTISVRYHVDQANATQPFVIEVFRAAKQAFSDNRTPMTDLRPVGSPITISGNGLSKGSHTLYVNVPGGLPLDFDPFHPYVLAVAEPNHKSAEVDKAHNQASFHIWTVGAVAEGFQLGFTYTTRDWTNQMAAALHNDDHYDRSIAYPWPSVVPTYKAEFAAANLDKLVDAAIKSLVPDPKHSDDVINFHFIGHSRGVVVISEAANDLVSYLRVNGYYGSYIKLTYLDPHPANNDYDVGVNASANLFGYALLKAYQAVADDKRVRVPQGVNEVEDFYQRTDRSKLTGRESFVNLQGLAPSEIDDEADVTILARNLTNHKVRPGSRRVVGHSEVTDWYQANVLEPGLVYTDNPIPE